MSWCHLFEIGIRITYFSCIYTQIYRVIRDCFSDLYGLIGYPFKNGHFGIRIAYINIRNLYDLSKEKGKKKGLKCLFLRPFVIFGVHFSGAAGSRTPVQTRNPYAFYMFSQSLIVGKEPAKGHKLNP